jgi:hypothetical protein
MRPTAKSWAKVWARARASLLRLALAALAGMVAAPAGVLAAPAGLVAY